MWPLPKKKNRVKEEELQLVVEDLAKVLKARNRKMVMRQSVAVGRN